MDETGPPPLSSRGSAKSPDEIHIFTHVDRFVIAAERGEGVAPTELTSTQGHPGNPASELPKSDVRSHGESFGLNQNVHCATRAIVVSHDVGDADEELRGNQRIRVEEYQKVVRGRASTGIPYPRDVVHGFGNDARAETRRQTGRCIATGIVHDDDLDAAAAERLELLLRGAQARESARDIRFLIERRDDHGEHRGASGTSRHYPYILRVVRPTLAAPCGVRFRRACYDPVITTGRIPNPTMASGESLPQLKGTVDLLVLKALSWGPMHGFGISNWLEEQSVGAVAIDDSAMYQVLHRLEARDLIEAEWGVSENNRKARYYRLTPAGRRYLRGEIDAWLRRSHSVSHILMLPTRGPAGS